MREVRTLIVDDEPLARRGVRQLLSPYRDFIVVGECANGREAVRSITQLKPDLVFLDIQMPGLDGLSVMRVHGARTAPLVVFVTAHQDYAVNAFEIEAVDYLVKPLSESRFRATVTRVREHLSAAPSATIAVPTERGELLLNASDVDWIEAQDDHADIHSGSRRYRLRASLTALEQRLDPARFIRTHRSAIVRVDHVREWRAGAGAGEAALVLKDGTVLPVSRRRLAKVKALLHR